MHAGAHCEPSFTAGRGFTTIVSVVARTSVTLVLQGREERPRSSRLPVHCAAATCEALAGKRVGVPLSHRAIEEQDMRTVKECRDGLGAALAVYRARCTALDRALEALGGVVPEPLADKKREMMVETLPVLDSVLSVLAAIDSPAAVKVIRKLFSSDCVEFRKRALEKLATMEIDAARKAIVSRTKWYSASTEPEKSLARVLLDRMQG